MKEGMIYQLFAKACRESGCAIKPSNDLDVIYRFTELLVRECADIAWKDSARYAAFDNDTVMNGKADVLALCSHHIKQHFGIEENQQERCK